MEIGKSNGNKSIYAHQEHDDPIAIHDFRSPSKKGVFEFWEKTHWTRYMRCYIV